MFTVNNWTFGDKLQAGIWAGPERESHTQTPEVIEDVYMVLIVYSFLSVIFPFRFWEKSYRYKLDYFLNLG